LNEEVFYSSFSFLGFFFDLIRMGINLKRFSSRAAHRNSQFVLDIAINELIIMIDEEVIRNGVNIKT